MAAIIAQPRGRNRKQFEIDLQCAFIISKLSKDQRLERPESNPGSQLEAGPTTFFIKVVVFSNNLRITLKENNTAWTRTKNFQTKGIGIRGLKRAISSMVVERTLDGGFVMKTLALSSRYMPLSVGMIPFKMLSSSLTSIDAYITAVIQMLQAQEDAAELIWESAPTLTPGQFKIRLGELGLVKNIMGFYGLLRIQSESCDIEKKKSFLKVFYKIFLVIRPALGKNAQDRFLPEALNIDVDTF